jgi:hypothetical protein
MLQELLTKLSPISQIFLPIITGVGIGIASRDKFDRTTENRMAKICEDVALKLFLPFFVIESVLMKSSPSYDLALAFVVGFLLPLFALFAMWLYKKALSERNFFTPHYYDLRFLTSTYGGGNRGTALFVLLFANSTYFNDYLKWFSLVDLGNFACLLLVITSLLARQYGAPLNDKRGLLSKTFDNYAFVTILLVVLYFWLRHLWPSTESLLSETVHFRKFIFSLLVFLAITLRFEHGALKNFFVDLLAFFSARLFTALCVIALVLPFVPNALPICLSVIILVLMPPSSFLPSMIGQLNASKDTLSYVNGFTGAVNVFYLCLIAVGIVVALSQALQ